MTPMEDTAINSHNRLSMSMKVENSKDEGNNEIKYWLNRYLEYTTIHGLIWYVHTDNKILKIFSLIFGIVIVFGLLAFLTYMSVDFSKSLDTELERIEWKKADRIRYPNFTVCYSKFFDSRLMKEHNISDLMANYMTMALDTSVNEYADHMVIDYKDYYTVLDQLKVELEDTLLRYNLSSLQDVYYRIAVRCEDFIIYCEEHDKFFYSNALDNGEKRQKCCGTLFDPKPFFVPTGTCFTSKQEIWEDYPSSFSSVKLWLHMNSRYFPKLDIKWKGSDAAERYGVFYALSLRDHPSAVLLKRPKKAAAGTTTLLSLSKEEINREKLSSRPCTGRNETFLQNYGMPYTSLNCDISHLQFLTKICSLSKWFGIEDRSDLPMCTPHYLLYTPLAKKNANREQGKCPFECHRTEYNVKSTSGGSDLQAIERYLETRNASFIHSQDTVIIQMYFDSFEFPYRILYQLGFDTFMSRVGGWMGLAVGASIVSLLELIYFGISIFLKVFCYKS